MFIIIPFRYKKISQYLEIGATQNQLSILDVGCGSHSSSLTKKWLRKDGLTIFYSGIDINLHYNNNEVDIRNMDKFYQMDISKLDFEDIPDNHFEVIVMSHIIEHLHNAEDVLIHLLPKLKTDGLLYLEFPNERSMTLPSMKGCLNFFDDGSHVHIHSKRELCNLLLAHHCQVKSVGRRRQWLRVLISPIVALFQLCSKGHVLGGTFWDLLGFADYIVVKKRG